MDLHQFTNKVIQNGSKYYRTMPWRTTQDPYYILLSEVMLQQTQVDRVVSYYEAFIKKYPSVEQLASAPLQEILALWSGLGYNRRAKWLKEAAQKIVSDFSGEIPRTIEQLTMLPGIGHNTAAAICVYAYNLPENFIETNIRTVYIYNLFDTTDEKVPDKKILSIQEKILTTGVDPRQWYLALMDYGTFLKKQHSVVTRKSSSYRKQSMFKGSLRQVRGAILKLLVQNPTIVLSDTSHLLDQFDAEFRQKAFEQLLDEGFIIKDSSGVYKLRK